MGITFSTPPKNLFREKNHVEILDLSELPLQHTRISGLRPNLRKWPGLQRLLDLGMQMLA
jgi:hypothetical protein